MESQKSIDSKIPYENLIKIWRTSKYIFISSSVIFILSLIAFSFEIGATLISVSGLSFSAPFFIFSSLLVWLLREHPYVKNYKQSHSSQTENDTGETQELSEETDAETTEYSEVENETESVFRKP